MTPRSPRARLAVCALAIGAALPGAGAADLGVTAAQRNTAQQVAQAGVPLADLAPNAPDSHVVKPGDTLWGISSMFLRSPWRWPALWGMNLAQIRNPHLIYPGQVLLLDRSGGRARLQVAQQVGPVGTEKRSPRMRVEPVDLGAIAAVPLHLIAPFMNEAVVFSSDELAAAPRIVAAPEGRVMMTRGDAAYVLGELGGLRDWRVFRRAVPLRDPETREVLGYEARFVGTAELTRPSQMQASNDGKPMLVPASFRMLSVREEVGVGDRLAPVPPRDFASYAPHAPTGPVDGRIISIYGDALLGGQNQIVALNRGQRDGLERGHVLSLWRAGALATDTTGDKRQTIRLPDERHGLLFVFNVFERVSYALILQVQEPVKAGDRFGLPE